MDGVVVPSELEEQPARDLPSELEEQPLLNRGSPAHEAAQLLRSSLGAGRIVLEVCAAAVLVPILMDPKVRAFAPIILVLLGVMGLYYILQRRSPQTAAYVIPYGQAAAGVGLVLAAAALPPSVLPALLEAEQRVPSDPVRWFGWLVGGLHLGSQAVPLRTKLGCEGTMSVLYAVALLVCAHRTGAAASAAYAPIAIEAILHGLGLGAALCLKKASRCAPVIANLESMASDVQQLGCEKERLDWDLRLTRHSLQQATQANDRLTAAIIERSSGAHDELSSKVSSDMQATVEADALRRWPFPYHSPSSSEGSAFTAKVGGNYPGAI